MSHPPCIVGMIRPQHMLIAHNDAAASANKIHDDAAATQHGFRGVLRLVSGEVAQWVQHACIFRLRPNRRAPEE